MASRNKLFNTSSIRLHIISQPAVKVYNTDTNMGSSWALKKILRDWNTAALQIIRWVVTTVENVQKYRRHASKGCARKESTSQELCGKNDWHNQLFYFEYSCQSGSSGECLLRLYPSNIVRRTSSTPKKQPWLVIYKCTKYLSLLIVCLSNQFVCSNISSTDNIVHCCIFSAVLWHYMMEILDHPHH